MKRKFRAKFYISMVALCLVLALVGKVEYMLFANKVTTDQGEMNSHIRYILMALILLVASSFFVTVLNMLITLLKNKGEVFKCTESGLENGMTFIILGAFLLAVRVDFIPWTAFTLINEQDKFIVAKVDVKQIKASPLAKIILKVKGFQFGADFVTPTVTRKEIQQYTTFNNTYI